MPLHIDLIMIWKWVRCPITWLNYTVRWITKVIYLVLEVICLVKSRALSFSKLIFENALHCVSRAISHGEFAPAELGGVGGGKMVSLLIVLV